jgi:F-type H+-transporting ATPase subunit delta
MIDRIIVKRYAEAFVGFAKETIGLEKALRDFEDLKDVIRENPEFLEMLRSPQLSYPEKCEFIDTVLRDGFSEETKSFLKAVLEKGRIDKIVDIAEYIRTSYGGEVEALIRTSFPLDLDLVREVETGLEKKFNRKFKFFIGLDADLLGGLQVIIGNTVVDGSVRRRLDELREKLITARI